MNENIYVTAVKVAKGKIELEYVNTEENRPYSTEEKDTPHPDLYNALKKMVPFLAKVYYQSKNHDSISINGFSSGKDSTLVVIKGMLTVSSGKKVAINSDAIDIEKDVYGFEVELEKVIEEIQAEAADFFFGNKRAATQEKLDFDQEEEGPLFKSVSQDQKNADIKEEVEKDNVPDGKMAAAEPEEHVPEETVPEQESNGDGVPGL
jgi:hypothetical protein